MTYPMWLRSSGQGYFEGAVACFLDTVNVDTSPLEDLRNCDIGLNAASRVYPLREYTGRDT